MAYFPMFVDISGRPCLVVGGGHVALRKVEVLLDFGADITVVSDSICDGIKDASVKTIQRDFLTDDIIGMKLVIAATDDRKKNHDIAVLCREAKIPVNAVDQIEDCSFIFPSYERKGDLVAAYSSGGKSPLLTQVLRDKCSMTPLLGELNDLLGHLRPWAMEHLKNESDRKAFYRSVYEWALENDSLPTEETAKGLAKTGINYEA